MKFDLLLLTAFFAVVSASPIPEPQHGGGGIFDCIDRQVVSAPGGRQDISFCADGQYHAFQTLDWTFSGVVTKLCQADGGCYDAYYGSYWDINQSSPPS